jgi:hypothetical protein
VVGYGRRRPDTSLVEEDQEKQAEGLVTYTQNRLTNAIDSAADYRAPLLAETSTYELTGYAPGDPTRRFVISDFVKPDPVDAQHVIHIFDTEIPYELQPSSGRQRRLIECVRTCYRRDDLKGLLPLGELETLAIQCEAYKLAFTPGLLAQVFQRNGQALLPYPAKVLGGKGADSGGYVDLDGNGHWWIPSGRAFLSPKNDDTAPEELAYARQHFFLLHRYRDAFHTDAVSTESIVTYDDYDLMMLETRDALGNRITAGELRLDGTIDPTNRGNDYRVLQPCLLMDPNRNRSAVAFNALGMVVGTAIMGKPLPAPLEGDTLSGFATDLTQNQTDAFFDADDPHAAAPLLLQAATTRIVYDLDRFVRTWQAHPNDQTKWQPAYAATLARETHASDPLPPHGLRIQISFSYSDGFGREIQKKIQAEPGPLVEGSSVVNQRWVASGWTIYNNKGKPVRQYEPFFSKRQWPDGTLSSDHRFEFGVKVGVSPVLFYDPAERIVATLHPNHTYEKVVFDPWQQMTFDVNDTCAPRNQQTGDPRTDPDIGSYVGEYFKAQPATWQTWRGQRIGGERGQEERNAALRAEAHADTPTTAHFDALGRPFLTVARNRVVCAGHDLDGTEDSFATRVELDIEGNQRAVRDERKLPINYLPTGVLEQRIVMHYAYDMLGNRIHQLSMEAGARWMLNDVAGKPILTWDSRGHNFATSYDVLRRPVQQSVRGTSAESDPRTLNRDVLVDKIEYGESPLSAPPAEEDRAQRLNLRTRIYRHFDSAGIASNARLDANGTAVAAYDFKGNLLHSTRRLVSDYTAIPDWLLNPQLDLETFEGSTSYDALNRPIQSVAPHSNQARAKRNVIQPVFNEANLLERVDVWLGRAAEPGALLDPDAEAPSRVGVVNIDYDAKAQRLRIDYKNGASTRYRYDPETLQLVDLYTRRGAAFIEDCDNPQPPPATIAAPECPPQSKACGLQKLHYTYDPAGNIIYIEDKAQQAIYFRNKIVEPSNDYVYDALYRLIQATGREHLGQGGAPSAHSHDDAGRVGLLTAEAAGCFAPNDGNAMGTYIERYVYDAVGNFLQMQHRGSDPAHPGWTRAYDYLEPSLIEDGSGGVPLKTDNQLTRTTLSPNGPNPQMEPYQHGGHGNIVRMPHLGGGSARPNMHWDFRNQLRQTDMGGGGVAFYVYDASGQRVRKVWEKAPGLIEERIYLGGFEIFRKHSGPISANTATLERETLHVRDDNQRIAFAEMRTLDTAGNDQAPRQLLRYQFGNHLGSASLELDEQARIISYEEYAPYGSSTYQAVRSQTETAK